MAIILDCAMCLNDFFDSEDVVELYPERETEFVCKHCEIPADARLGKVWHKPSTGETYKPNTCKRYIEVLCQECLDNGIQIEMEQYHDDEYTAICTDCRDELIEKLEEYGIC